MIFTEKQLKDFETIEYYIPPGLRFIKITDDDKKMFFENSERGLHKEMIKDNYFNDGFNVLREGKRWRGIHIHEMYEPGILDGSMPYYVILGGYKDKKRETKWWNYWWYKLTKDLYVCNPLPRGVVDFIKKEMFKGIDSELIEKVYQDILNKD